MHEYCSYLCCNHVCIVVVSIQALPRYIRIATRLKQAVIVPGVHERSLISRIHWTVGKERVRHSNNDLLSTYVYTIPWSLILHTAHSSDQHQHKPRDY